MLPLDVVAIEQEARRLRAVELQRIQGIVLARLFQFGQSLTASLRSGAAEIGSVLRTLFHTHHRTDRIRHCD
ncbi:MAG: hypothetical protein U1A72_22270 [Sulfuritalea sp.]|nr:hypothetical protein [Sulfuritalea sp.]